MSRSRDYIDPRTGETIWFDTKNLTPTAEQLELLALVERCDLDDLLEENLTQRGIYDRLHRSLREANIPSEVLSRRDEWRESRQVQPQCRMCGKAGDSTKHHFVNRWILRELEDYTTKWSNRRDNCIPICIDCHRDLHARTDDPISIAPFLTDDEKVFADRAITAFADERPRIFILIARGTAYESQLLRDWLSGQFQTVGASLTAAT